MAAKPVIECKECGKGVERTKEESIDLGVPFDVCNACLALDSYDEE